jgi:hypothetical protein
LSLACWRRREASPPPPGLSSAGRLVILALAPLLLGASFSVVDLTKSAERIFRGRCLGAVPVTVDFKGRPLVATAYTFEVSEYLKGNGPRALTFRQVGTPDRAVTDLGRIAGLTVFAPGNEYVVFLRPESGIGLTSAAGRGRGVLLVSGETVQVVDVDGRTPAPEADRIAYAALRLAVQQVLKGPPRRK